MGSQGEGIEDDYVSLAPLLKAGLHKSHAAL